MGQDRRRCHRDSRVDIGSADTGMLEPFRLYRSTDSSLTVMMEIMAQTRSGRGIEIGDGRLTFLKMTSSRSQSGSRG
jgi:hypothetical protein